MSTNRSINSVAVIGSGTMGMGIAALCANADCDVVLLDVTRETAQKAVERMTSGRAPLLDEPDKAENITVGSIQNDLSLVAKSDWICEAVIEDLQIKREIFSKLEGVRKDGSIITTNTSGIPLKSIYANMPQRLGQDIAVTHFFNPVKIMRLLELVPGEFTTPDVIESLSTFSKNRLGKGVVYAKDTVNFIGNRIGCFWMLAGLHKAKDARQQGLSIEQIDALMSAPMGFPPTGLYGLIDLVGLDVMALVADNLATNLPSDDPGIEYTKLPAAEQILYENGQLGRKTGGGFYRITKLEDGGKLKEVYDLENSAWRKAEQVTLDQHHQNFVSLMKPGDRESRFVWDLMSASLCYAADLVPQISDDIVNIDRAMRWGFNWAKGPFELIDDFGVTDFIQQLRAEERSVPELLTKLETAGYSRFYITEDNRFFSLDGNYHTIPPE